MSTRPSPPSSQVGLVLNGEYYWFHRAPADDPECDTVFNNACFVKSNVKFKQLSNDIISINGGKAYGCAPALVTKASKIPGYESGYGECTSKGWKPKK